MAENNEGYEVVDKSKVKLDDEGNVVSEDTSETSAEEEKAAEEALGDFGDLPPVDVNSLLKSFIAVLAAQSWQWLGLVKNPVTGQMEKDLAQAKVAIDAISALIAQLEKGADPAEQRELQSLLSDLRINYVQQTASGS